jgi:hypothetical protein
VLKYNSYFGIIICKFGKLQMAEKGDCPILLMEDIDHTIHHVVF